GVARLLDGNIGSRLLKFVSNLGKSNFLGCQLLSFFPLKPPDNATHEEDSRYCMCRDGPTCDPVQAVGAGLRGRGAKLGFLYLCHSCLIAREGVLPLLVFSLLARR